jgi:uncharacterized delta-60 repeat protein
MTTDLGGEDDALAVALQPDGKIVTAGSTYGSETFEGVLVRYLPDGSLDTTFGDAGKVTTDFGGQDNNVWAIALQPDGKIIAAGGGFTLARYLPNGSLVLTAHSPKRKFP